MRRIPAALALLVLSAALVYTAMDNYRFYTVYPPETVSIEKYRSTLFVDSVKVARYIRERTEPDDHIFQWGLEPEIYFLADRRCPNPFLVSVLPAWSEDPRQTVTRMIQSLRQKQPAYVVIQPEWANFQGGEEIAAYVQENCTEDTTIGYARIFRCPAR
jgi:hypothetical protein